MAALLDGRAAGMHGRGRWRHAHSGERSSRQRLAWLVACVAGAAVLAGGCQQDLRTVPLTASRRPFVRDIPVPMSFDLVNQRTHSQAQGSFRMIEHSYFGYAEPIVVNAFYRDEMARCGWRLLSEQNVQGTYRLSFQKGRETAVVTVGRERRDLREGALATVIVKPIGVVVTGD